MKDTVTTYLDSLDAPESLRFRFEVLVARCELLLQDQADAVFASEYVTAEGARVFESIFAFTEGFLTEARVAEEPEDQVDLVPLRHNVHHWILNTSAFDLRQATDLSRASMDVWLAENRVATLRASKRNCNALMEIGLRYVRPNVAI